MKKIFVVISLVVFVGSTVSSCGGSSINCTNSCNKQKQCDSTTDVASCNTTCSKLNDTLNDDVLSKLNSCVNQDCSDIAICDTQAFQNCKTDLGGLFNKICGQLQSCGGFVDAETCVNSLTDIENSGAFNALKCLDGGFLNSLASCASSTSCNIPAVTDCINQKTQFLNENP